MVLDASEERVTPVDSKMEELGGIVYRTAREDFEAEQDAKDVAAMREDLAELKKEEKEEKQQERKDKLRAKIDNLHERLHAKLEHAKEHSELQEQEAKAKIHAMENKAAQSRGNAKAAIEERITSIRKKSNQSSEKMEKVQEA